MAQFERSEEETIQAIKDWWKENGRAVIAGVVLGIGGIVGVRYWFDHQQQSQHEASQAYSNVQMALQSGNRERAARAVDALMEEYDSTAYAVLGALGMGRLELEAGQPESAERYLRWALVNSDTGEYRHLARQRLARLLLAGGQPEQAAELLDGVDEAGYGSIYAEIRGDIAQAREEPGEARSHYQQALLGAENALRRQLLEMKLAELSAVAGAPDSEVMP
ncbi:tetratricopeptide repeat protein [Thiohalophilus sp.]|uniref:YfgM family protein n=1 Tax=Thiohalophilus sp. TaxID=3028392 RepID=UPI002ACEF8F0|nr:tetratricopeptide repeat protein [Thiohalophilus sp.]MDZ7663390.1 tetratricopeptide repeat protein [Thiohalophilus sp.]